MTSAPSIAHAFEQNTAKYTRRVFLKEKRNGAWAGLSWSDVAAASRRLRAGMLKIGLTPGDRLAILSENCPQWVITDLAALGMGGIVVPLYPTSSADEIEHVLGDSGARAIAVNGADKLRKIEAMAARLPQLESIIAMRTELPSAGPAERLRVVTMETLADGGEAPLGEASPSDVATIIYTSGTTGESKGVVLTHGNILANC